MLIKGLKGSTIVSQETMDLVHQHTDAIIIGSIIFFTLLFQVLYFLKMNVFKIIILMGTFALALAFAGNDLVNFIGVPLAGYSSYMDLMAQGGAVSTDNFLMTSLLESAKTPWYFLFAAGIVMVIALATSKKAHNVIKTAVDLSRQSDGEESFGTSPVARVLVRTFSNAAETIDSVIPIPVKRWIGSRFNQTEMILEDKASFDLVRASVNVVLSGLLIAVGTSLKLPLSTTYVAFMVAMGTSLADKAWGRESAVYRITGVLSVIGGWFITAGAAFSICFIVAMLIYFGGTAAIVALVALAVFSLVRSHLVYKKKCHRENLKEEVNTTVAQLQKTTDSHEALNLFRKLSREELSSVLNFASEALEKAINGFEQENLKDLKKVLIGIEDKKVHLKQVKRVGTLGVTQLDYDIAVEKGLYYYQGNDFASEIVYSIRRLVEPCKEHIDNNFKPLSDAQRSDLDNILLSVVSFINLCAETIVVNDYDNVNNLNNDCASLSAQLIALKKAELKRIQNEKGSTKVSMVYLNIIQEIQNVVIFSGNMVKVSRKFQIE